MVSLVLFGSSELTLPFRTFLAKTNGNDSPAPEIPTPFHLISDDPADIAAMKKAEKNPQLVMLSDWDHLTAQEYQRVQVESRLNVL